MTISGVDDGAKAPCYIKKNKTLNFLEYKSGFDFRQYNKPAGDIPAILGKDRITFEDYLALISDGALEYLDRLAEKSAQVTRLRFGKTIGLYAPLYLSNDCNNSCLYCGFNAKNKIVRKTLTLAEAKKEAQYLKQSGMSNILLVSSENPGKVPVKYFTSLLDLIRKDFSSISFEIYPLDVAGYKELVRHGADGLTIYQESYDEKIYKKMHPSGKKSNYGYRLETPERAAQAGLKKITIGSLLGLNDFFQEGFYLGLHLSFLIKKYWGVFFSVSFPRIQEAPGGFRPSFPVSDKKFVQLLCAMRLLCPEAGINLSTRESAGLRDNLMKIGVTAMSAGSKTSPGGYSSDSGSDCQFAVADDRSVKDIYQAIQKSGLQPVFKDWEGILSK